MRQHAMGNHIDLLLVLNFVALADEALLMLFPHMCIQFVISKGALPTELAEGMNSAFNLMRRNVRMSATLHGRKMVRQLVRGV